MRLNEIKVGEHIELEFEYHGKVVHTKSIVESVTDNGIRALAPILSMQLIVPNKKNLINVILYSDGYLYKWECKQEGIFKEGSIKIIELSCENDSITYNRRNAYRIKINQDINYKYVTDTFKGLIKEISILGIKMLSNISHSIGEVIELDLQADNVKIHIQASIIRQSRDSNSIYKYEYGLIILNNVEKDLSKYINNIQRSRLKRRHLEK